MPGPAHCTHWHTGHRRNQEKANMAAGHEKMKPPLVTSSACIEYQVICPGWPMILPSLPSRDGSHEARLRVWWWTISLSTVLSSLHRSSAWLVNSNNFLHLDQSQILGLATPHLWSQYPVPGTRYPPSTGLITPTRSGRNSHHAAHHHRDLILNWHDQVSRRDRKFLCPILLSFCIFTFSKQAPRPDTHSCRLTEGDRGELNWQWMVWWLGCGFCGAPFSQLKLIYFSTLISQEKL